MPQESLKASLLKPDLWYRIDVDTKTVYPNMGYDCFFAAIKGVGAETTAMKGCYIMADDQFSIVEAAVNAAN